MKALDHIRQLFETNYRTSPVSSFDSREARVLTRFADVSCDTGLSAKDAVVRYLNVSCYAHLTRKDTMIADLTTTGYSHLCTEERGLAHFHVMGNLHEVIHLSILANDSRTHHRSVHTSVGSELYIVLDDHITDLRNLTVDTLCIGFKAKTIGIIDEIMNKG